MNTIKAPTVAISKFLDRLIRPLFDKHAQSTTIIDGSDLICRLHNYASNGYVRASTQLCTFDVTDLYTMLPQEESLDILCEFLSQHGYSKVQGVPMEAIRKLASIVLTENAFVYDGKFYKQCLGGAMGSPFTLTLANIFMWKWEKNFIRRLNETNEIYGR